MPYVTLPNDPKAKGGIWKPRHYQMPLWSYLENGGKRAMEVWHRRAGKDEICLAWTSVAMHKRKGNYWHMLPEAAQARKAIWDAVDPHRGMKRIDIAFPEKIRKTTRNQDMFIETIYGSTWQVIGSDNFNSLVGSPPIGIVFSEWALADPLAWGYLKPILEENNGWALFITTSRGHNHAERMYNAASVDEDWHSGLLTPDKTGLLNEEQLVKIKEDYIVTHGEVLGSALFEQEYLCSFEAAVLGAVYGKEMRTAREEGRIREVSYDPALPVETWWDIGFRDDTSIWFIQREKYGGGLRAIDYYEKHLEGLDHYVKIVKEKPYSYSQHIFPHDAKKNEFGPGKTILQQAWDLGLKATGRPRVSSLDIGIKKTRPLIARTTFDAKKCERGLDCLSQYHYEWNPDKSCLSTKPAHDWSCHGADAFRTGAEVTLKRNRTKPKPNEVCVI